MKYLIFIILLFSIAGCDIFNTRVAEIPDQPRANFRLAVTPEFLIENFINSYSEKNNQSYSGCFPDSSFTQKRFIFLPSSGAASLYPSFSDGWNKLEEDQYFNSLIAKVQKNLPISVSLTNVNSVQQGDSIIYTAKYSLSAPIEDSSIPSYYQGELKFYLSRDSRLIWNINSWQDIKNTTSPSWSDLKGRLY